MPIPWWTVVVPAAAVLTLGAGGREKAASPPCLEELPAEIRAPDGNDLAFALSAEGFQVYVCAQDGASAAWKLQAPEASLSEVTGGSAGTHSAGPTWRAEDGSSVVGAKVAGASPDPAAIPWLLLGASAHEGSGRMAQGPSGQRIRTSGGNAPAQGCDAKHVGAISRVPYRAVYCFYRKAG